MYTLTISKPVQLRLMMAEIAQEHPHNSWENNFLKIFFLKKLCNKIKGRVTERPWVGWRRRNPTTTPKGESPLAQFFYKSQYWR